MNSEMYRLTLRCNIFELILYSAFADKTDGNYQVPVPGRNSYKAGKFTLLCLWSDT